jgi:hypothetical protein
LALLATKRTALLKPAWWRITGTIFNPDFGPLEHRSAVVLKVRPLIAVEDCCQLAECSGLACGCAHVVDLKQMQRGLGC